MAVILSRGPWPRLLCSISSNMQHCHDGEEATLQSRDACVIRGLMQHVYRPSDGPSRDPPDDACRLPRMQQPRQRSELSIRRGCVQALPVESFFCGFSRMSAGQLAGRGLIWLNRVFHLAIVFYLFQLARFLTKLRCWLASVDHMRERVSCPRVNRARVRCHFRR